MADRVIFHVDANSAFLSWTAAYKVKVLGETQDLREIPSVVAGDKASRHSIILAKSGPAKKYGIQTGEPLFQALEKCPDLVVVPPDYELYVEASRQHHRPTGTAAFRRPHGGCGDEPQRRGDGRNSQYHRT